LILFMSAKSVAEKSYLPSAIAPSSENSGKQFTRSINRDKP